MQGVGPGSQASTEARLSVPQRGRKERNRGAKAKVEVGVGSVKAEAEIRAMKLRGAGDNGRKEKKRVACGEAQVEQQTTSQANLLSDPSERQSRRQPHSQGQEPNTQPWVGCLADKKGRALLSFHLILSSSSPSSSRYRASIHRPCHGLSASTFLLISSVQRRIRASSGHFLLSTAVHRGSSTMLPHPPEPAAAKPPPPSSSHDDNDSKGQSGEIPTYDQAVAESIAAHNQASAQNRHLPPPPPSLLPGSSQPAGSYGVHAPVPGAPHRIVYIQDPNSPHTMRVAPGPSASAMPPVLLYTADPSTARRRALARFAKAFMWAWLISILIAFMTGAIQFVDYDDDGEDWQGWRRVTGISALKWGGQ